MKRKITDDLTKVNGLYINEMARGFFGDKNQGNKMLQAMGLQPNKIPFSIATFLRKKRVFWKDRDGQTACISFKFKQNQLECHGSYLKKRKVNRIFLEWGAHEDPEMVARLESEAIGDLCMKCIYENLIE